MVKLRDGQVAIEAKDVMACREQKQRQGTAQPRATAAGFRWDGTVSNRARKVQLDLSTGPGSAPDIQLRADGLQFSNRAFRHQAEGRAGVSRQFARNSAHSPCQVIGSQYRQSQILHSALALDDRLISLLEGSLEFYLG